MIALLDQYTLILWSLQRFHHEWHYLSCHKGGAENKSEYPWEIEQNKMFPIGLRRMKTSR